MPTTAVKPACGNCRFYTMPKPGNQCGLCNVRGSFNGILRPEPEFWCCHFSPTSARRLKGDEEQC